MAGWLVGHSIQQPKMMRETDDGDGAAHGGRTGSQQHTTFSSLSATCYTYHHQCHHQFRHQCYQYRYQYRYQCHHQYQEDRRRHRHQPTTTFAVPHALIRCYDATMTRCCDAATDAMAVAALVRRIPWYECLHGQWTDSTAYRKEGGSGSGVGGA